MNIYVTYELWNPIKNLPFYVGAGSQNRPNDHLKEAKKAKNKSHKYNTIRHIWDQSKEVEIKIVFQGTREKAFLLEKELIKKYGRANLGLGPLTNLTDGGDGGTPGLKDSEETIYKKSISHKGCKNHMFGKTHDENVRKKISENRDYNISGKNNGRAKSYKLIFADGSEQLFEGNFFTWCKENKYDFSVLLATIKKQKPCSKGKTKGMFLVDLGNVTILNLENIF